MRDSNMRITDPQTVVLTKLHQYRRNIIHYILTVLGIIAIDSYVQSYRIDNIV